MAGRQRKPGVYMSISERKKKILAAVVDEYIRTAEPVGSKVLAERSGLGCSSATIRNELAELVNMGYLEQPHTSAGRVPTALGYRMYVNELMQKQKLSLEETEELNSRLEKKLSELDNTIEGVSRLASQLTNYSTNLSNITSWHHRWPAGCVGGYSSYPAGGSMSRDAPYCSRRYRLSGWWDRPRHRCR